MAIRGTLSLLAAVVAALTVAPGMGALGAGPTCPSGYSYAGLFQETASAGVAATVTPLEQARVEKGHVAAWINVGGKGAWLQVGLNATPGSPQKLYYEIMPPGGSDTEYVQVASNVPTGQAHRLALAEIPGRPDWWRVYVDGSQAGPDVSLPGSHGNWHASVSAENWRPDDGSCNYYHYGFGSVQLQPNAGGAWNRGKTLFEGVDPGYRLSSAGAGAYEALGHL